LELLVERFELLIETFELLIETFELLIETFELLVERFELLDRSFPTSKQLIHLALESLVAFEPQLSAYPSLAAVIYLCEYRLYS
jgi:hypothetical protein